MIVLIRVEGKHLRTKKLLWAIDSKDLKGIQSVYKHISEGLDISSLVKFYMY